MAENQLAPRGEDAWVGVERWDADSDSLARAVAKAIADPRLDEKVLSGRDGTALAPTVVADAVWRRSPTEACLLLDDVHLLPVGSTGAAWLNDFLDVLPSNGHVVLASRSEPPISLVRMDIQGEVMRFDENDLRFSDDELQGLAEWRGLDHQRFEDTGGWPAMVELAASVSQPQLAGSYLWEKVLEPMGTLRRHVLAVLCDLGGADDALASEAIGAPVDLATVFDGVPLVARGADGWHVPHGLWRTAPSMVLAPTERSDIRRRAVEHLGRRGRFDAAFGLVQDAELWHAAPAVLRAACLAMDRLVPSQLGRWLSQCPEGVLASSAGRLAVGMHTTFTEPARAVKPLREAAAQSRAEGDLDAELAAIAQLGQVAWWHQDLAALGQLVTRTCEVEPSGHPVACALAAIARAMAADLVGDDLGVVAELDGVESKALSTVWAISAGWFCGVVHLDLGQNDAATGIFEQLTPTVGPAMRHVVDALRLRTWWRQGRVDDVLAELPAVIAAEVRGGATYSVHLGQILGSVLFSHAGDIEAGRRYLEDALATAPPPPAGRLSAQSASAMASLQLAMGDEPQAAAILQEALNIHGLDQGQDRRAWRQVLALSYVLLPETRKHWDTVNLRGHLGVARAAAVAVVAIRNGGGEQLLQSRDLSDLTLVRAALHHRFAAELAVGLAAAGRPEGRVLVEVLGPAGRRVLRDTVAAESTLARPARSLLSAVPAPPEQHTYLEVLGPMALRRDGPDGEEVTDPSLRTRRIQGLVAFLVSHRSTTRSAITATFWPDLDDRSAANNLNVALSHVLRLLEPWRDVRDPGYLLRLEGQLVKLRTGGHLRLDVDDFDEHLAAAARAEVDGLPSLALEHDLAATDLYRGALYGDLPEVDWLALEREHYQSSFVTAAVRAGQLLLGRGDNMQAREMAQRALASDPWAEPAYAVLVGAALAGGDRSTASRLLERCIEALADLGIEPSASTRQLRRRLSGNDS